MSTMLLIGTLAILGRICYEDFRTRMISIWLLIGFSVFQAISLILNQPFLSILEQSCINISILILLFSMVLVYFFLKHGHWVNIFDNYIGTGDMIMLLILSPGFSPAIFLVFILGCFILTLIITGLVAILRKGRLNTIPLAGYLALFFGLTLVISHFFPNYLPNDDSILFVILSDRV